MWYWFRILVPVKLISTDTTPSWWPSKLNLGSSFSSFLKTQFNISIISFKQLVPLLLHDNFKDAELIYLVNRTNSFHIKVSFRPLKNITSNAIRLIYQLLDQSCQQYHFCLKLKQFYLWEKCYRHVITLILIKNLTILEGKMDQKN